MLRVYCHYSYAGYKLYNLTKDGAKEITSSDFVRRHGLKSSSSVQSAANALYDSEMIIREGDIYFVSNRFLGFWIMSRYGVGFTF